jgi:WD40 repeat protein
MALSSDGHHLAVGGVRWQPNPHPQIAIIDLPNLAVRTTIDGPFQDWNSVASLCWTLDGRRVVAATNALGRPGPEKIKVFDGDSGVELPAATTDDTDATQLAYTPDGEYLVVTSLRDLKIVDASSHQVMQRIVMSNWPLGETMAMSHDGRHLAVSSATTVTIWSLE